MSKETRRSTTRAENSNYKVVLHFHMNGWTLSYFEHEEDISGWVSAMQEKHGRIVKKNIADLKKGD